MTADSEVTQLRGFLDKLPQEPCDVKRPEEFCSICKKVNAQVYYDCQKMRRSKGLIIDSETQEKEYDIEDLIKKVDEKIKDIPDKETKFEVVKERDDDGISTLEMDDPDHPMIEIIKPNYKKPEEAKFEVIKEKNPVKFEQEEAPKKNMADVDEKNDGKTPSEEDVAVFELAEPVKEKPKEPVKFQIAKKKPNQGSEETDEFWDGVKVEPVLEEGTVVDEKKTQISEKGGKEGEKKETAGKEGTKTEDEGGEEDEPMEVTPVEVLDEDENDDGEVVMAQILEEDDDDINGDAPGEDAVVDDEPSEAEEKPMVEFVKKTDAPKKKVVPKEENVDVVKGEPAPEAALKIKKLPIKKIRHPAGAKAVQEGKQPAETTEVWVTEDESPAKAKKEAEKPAEKRQASKETTRPTEPFKKAPLKPKVKKVKRP